MTTRNVTTNAANNRTFKAAFSLYSLRKKGKTTDKSECEDGGFHDTSG